MLSIGLAAALLAGCSGSRSSGPDYGFFPTPSPSPAAPAGASPAPAAVAPPLLVVVEARGHGARYATEPGVGDSYDTVAIAGLDGFARARATFSPRTVPALPGGGTPRLPPPAVVAAGAAFYADGAGAVRRLTPEGADTEVADFATTGQQELWFAVSPDGKHLAASVITVPAAGAAWQEDLLFADAGGTPTRVRHLDLGTATPAPAVVVGWDLGGPLVQLNASLVATPATGGWQLHGGPLARLDAQGNPGPPLGGGCTPWSSAPDGSVLCTGPPATVRDPGGNVIWSIPRGSYSLQGRALAPDSGHVATDLVLIAADGWAEKLPFGLFVEGWADSRYLVGQVVDPAGKGNIDYVLVGDAERGHNLGFTGVFVGGLPTPPDVRNVPPSPAPSPRPPSPSPAPSPSA